MKASNQARFTKITVGRDDLNMKEHGAAINARMGLNTWAAFVGTDQGRRDRCDVAMLESEVTPVLKTLRKNGIDVVAIHNHMIEASARGDLPALLGSRPSGKAGHQFQSGSRRARQRKSVERDGRTSERRLLTRSAEDKHAKSTDADDRNGLPCPERWHLSLSQRPPR